MTVSFSVRFVIGVKPRMSTIMDTGSTEISDSLSFGNRFLNIFTPFGVIFKRYNYIL